MPLTRPPHPALRADLSPKGEVRCGPYRAAAPPLPLGERSDCIAIRVRGPSSVSARTPDPCAISPIPITSAPKCSPSSAPRPPKSCSPACRNRRSSPNPSTCRPTRPSILVEAQMRGAGRPQPRGWRWPVLHRRRRLSAPCAGHGRSPDPALANGSPPIRRTSRRSRRARCRCCSSSRPRSRT